jgi:hypothetical protein
MSATQTALIDYRDNCWFLNAPALGAEMGFWTLASVLSFAANNLRMQPALSNRAIVQRFKVGA